LPTGNIGKRRSSNLNRKIIQLDQDGGVSILEYAEGTIIFMEHDLAKARNMKLVLCLFKQLSGLKISYNKSEMFCFGRAKQEHDNSCSDVS
jgi:hypothetical protein